MARQAVFDLIGRNAGLKREFNARGFIHPKFDAVKERSGLSFEKRVSRVPAGRGSPKATGV